jgi:hypothetical protein
LAGADRRGRLPVRRHETSPEKFHRGQSGSRRRQQAPAAWVPPPWLRLRGSRWPRSWTVHRGPGSRRAGALAIQGADLARLRATAPRNAFLGVLKALERPSPSLGVPKNTPGSILCAPTRPSGLHRPKAAEPPPSAQEPRPEAEGISSAGGMAFSGDKRHSRTPSGPPAKLPRRWRGSKSS